jgi:hypothetical protein
MMQIFSFRFYDCWDVALFPYHTLTMSLFIHFLFQQRRKGGTQGRQERTATFFGCER